MKMPKELGDKTEWVIVGPMGPMLPEKYSSLPVMAVDGGAHWTKKMSLWIGDGDSYDTIPPEVTIFNLPPEKDSSDFSCALRLFDDESSYCIHLWGFSGGRKDHELFVWGEILSFLEAHPESKIILYGKDGRVETHFLGSGEWQFRHEGLFSLGCLRKIRVKLTGDVKYSLPEETWLLPLTSLGLSNEGSGEIRLENNGAAFIYYPEGA